MNLRGKTVSSASRGRGQSKEANYDIRLDWSPLSWADSNGPITVYIFYWRESLLEEGEYQNLTTSEPQYLFKDVQSGEK